MMQIQVKKIHPNAVVPTKRDGNLAFDLHCVADEDFFTKQNKDGSITRHIRLYPHIYNGQEQQGYHHIFHTGLQIALPKGYGCLYRDRSGLGAKYLVHVTAGCIDNSYRGEWMVSLINLSNQMYEVTEGDRIIQCVLVPEYELEFLEVDELSETWRGEKGFGSSGK